jgi:hypothetical protein
MSIAPGSWSILGIAAAIAMHTGIVLLVAYAVQRGLVHRELDGTDPGEAGPETPPPVPEPRNRTLGLAGAIVLAVGLGLGLLSAVSGWGATMTGTNQGDPDNCAQSWSGCPPATPVP